MNLRKITDAEDSHERCLAYAKYLQDLFHKDAETGGKGVEFDFVKKDGTIRHAIGTYKPYENTSGIHRTPNPNQFSYFDIEKQSYRSFMTDQLLVPNDWVEPAKPEIEEVQPEE